MAKIMLVEDDNNLREIYEARLLAEGYEIVSAKDGEEALALAVKEKPDLIISDVMMPKISGFDMLDILRSTPETKNTKVIMMTALSQTEDKGRADKLGADRYLVKSQVTLEDVAKVAQDVLNDVGAPAAVSPTTSPTGVPEPATAPLPVTEPAMVTSDPAAPTVTPIVVTTPEPTGSPITDPLAATNATPTSPVVEEPVTDTPIPVTEEAAVPVVESAQPDSNEPTAAPVVTPITIQEPAEVETEAATAPEALAEPAPEMAEPISPEEPIASPAPQMDQPAISEDLSQTTQDEQAQAESQINQILAQAIEPESDEPLAPPPAEEQVVEPTGPTTAEPSAPNTIEVTPMPTEAEVVTEPAESTPDTFASPEVIAPDPTSTPEEVPTNHLQDNTDSVVTGAKKVIQPLNDITAKPNLEELLKQEEANAAVPATPLADQVVSPGDATPPIAPASADSEKPVSNPPTGSTVSPNDISL